MTRCCYIATCNKPSYAAQCGRVALCGFLASRCLLHSLLCYFPAFLPVLPFLKPENKTPSSKHHQQRKQKHVLICRTVNGLDFRRLACGRVGGARKRTSRHSMFRLISLFALPDMEGRQSPPPTLAAVLGPLPRKDLVPEHHQSQLGHPRKSQLGHPRTSRITCRLAATTTTHTIPQASRGDRSQDTADHRCRTSCKPTPSKRSSQKPARGTRHISGCGRGRLRGRSWQNAPKVGATHWHSRARVKYSVLASFSCDMLSGLKGAI